MYFTVCTTLYYKLALYRVDKPPLRETVTKSQPRVVFRPRALNVASLKTAQVTGEELSLAFTLLPRPPLAGSS